MIGAALIRALRGRSRREAVADDLAARQAEAHAAAMRAADACVTAAQATAAQATENERAAQALLRRLAEDLPDA